jgi:hypothetical protein
MICIGAGRVLNGCSMLPDVMKEARKIGFNKSVSRSGRTLHVQTEVLGRNELTIRTTVLEHGVVRFSDSQVCPGDVSELEQIRALVLAQHTRLVEQVTEGTVA